MYVLTILCYRVTFSAEKHKIWISWFLLLRIRSWSQLIRIIQVQLAMHCGNFVAFDTAPAVVSVLESWLDFTGELEPPDPLARLPQLKWRMKQLLMDLGKVQQMSTMCSVWAWSQVGGKHLRAVCVFVSTSSAHQQVQTEPNAQWVLFKNTVKKVIDDNLVQ